MILDHTLGLFTHPDREWQSIREDRHSMPHVFFTHVPLLALIPVLAAYYGTTQVGWSIGDGPVTRLTPESAMQLCGITYVAFLIGVWLFGEFINWMAVTYGSEDSAKRHMGTALAVYVTAPIFLAGIVGVYPEIWLNLLVTLLAVAYSVYLLYEGIPILMNIPKEQGFLYATSAITVGLVLMVGVRVGSVLVWSMGIGPVYME